VSGDIRKIAGEETAQLLDALKESSKQGIMDQTKTLSIMIQEMSTESVIDATTDGTQEMMRDMSGDQSTMTTPPL